MVHALAPDVMQTFTSEIAGAFESHLVWVALLLLAIRLA